MTLPTCSTTSCPPRTHHRRRVPVADELAGDHPRRAVAADPHGGWSIGIGIGSVDEPLPASTRSASGSAFIRARDAVERAKRSPDHIAVEIDPDRRLRGPDVEPILRQTVRLRARRSAEGWQLADLLAAGASRPDAAESLGITPQAVAKRFAAADLRDEDVLHAALVQLLADADERA